MFRKTVNWYKFILCILVVWIHSVNTQWFPEAVPYVAELENFVMNWIAAAAVPGFFLMSGYLFYRNFTMESLMKKWKSRFFSIVIPFVLWNAVYYIVSIFMQFLPGFSSMTGKNAVLINGREILSALLDYKYNPVFWYMQFLIIFTFLAPVVWLFLKNKISGAVVLAALAAACMNRVMDVHSMRIALMMQWLVIYLTGAYIGIHGKTWVEGFRKKKQMLLCAVGLFVIACFALLQWPAAVLPQLLYRFSSAALVWYIVACVPLPTEKVWMQFTFYVYASHHLIVRIINKLANHFFGNSMAVGIVVYFLMPAVVIVLCTVSGIIVKKWLPRTAFLFGISQSEENNKKKAEVKV